MSVIEVDQVTRQMISYIMAYRRTDDPKYLDHLSQLLQSLFSERDRDISVRGS